MPYCHRSSKGEMQTCMQASIPSSSDPEGTCLYRCTGYLKSLRGQFLRAGFSTRIERIADRSPHLASVALQQSVPSSCRGNAGHWEPGVPTLARMMQIRLVRPCGINLGSHRSTRCAKTQLVLKPCNVMAPLALLLSPGRNLALQQCLLWDSSSLVLITRYGRGMRVPQSLLRAACPHTTASLGPGARFPLGCNLRKDGFAKGQIAERGTLTPSAKRHRQHSAGGRGPCWGRSTAPAPCLYSACLKDHCQAAPPQRDGASRYPRPRRASRQG